MMDVNLKVKAVRDKVFKAYDVRGLYPEELDHNTIELIAKAFSIFLKKLDSKPTCIIGEDVRWSSPEISEIIKKELHGAGVDIIDIGLATSPLFVYSLARSKATGGIMVTASHNAIRFNGLKIYKGIEAFSASIGFPELKEIISSGLADYKKGNGNLTKADFSDDYINFLLSKAELRREVHAVFDAGGGAAGPLIKKIFAREGKIKGEGILLDPDTALIKRETNPLLPEAQKNAREAILKNKAEVGFVFDPDADRVIVLDEHGEVVRGDGILWLIAKKFALAGEGVVYDACRASRFLAEDLAADSIKCHKSRVGHSFIKNVMRQEDASFGGEISGHYYFKDFFYADSALYAVMKILSILSFSKLKLSELVSPYFRYIHSGEINFEVKDKNAIVVALEAKYPDADRDYFDGATFKYPDWWFNVRPSNTEDLLRLVIEANSKSKFDAKKDELFGLLFSKGAKLE